MSAGSGSAKRRRCHDRSKSGSTIQCGGANPNQAGTSLCRKFGTTRLARSIMLTKRPQSGVVSKTMTATIVDRRIGSRSILQEKKSGWVICDSRASAMKIRPCACA